MKKIKRGEFRASDLRIVGRAPPPDSPPLRVGDRCRLLSGGPLCLVTDTDLAGDLIVVAWEDEAGGIAEATMSRGVFRREGPAA